MPGRLYLIPIPIAPNALHTLAAEVQQVTGTVLHYFAENARTSRRFLKDLHPELVMETVNISEIDKHRGPDFKLLRQWLKEGKDIGIMSEAGCPGIADPGSDLVAAAHAAGGRVVPLTGPSALILALMASGLSGQSFAFHGYLPVKEPARSQRIKSLENLSAREHQTQIFIETPYRNNPLLAELLKHCQPQTRICIAQNLTAPDAFIKTVTAADWKKNLPQLQKAPAVFLLQA
jgi:16S rRNA (cytidine1402-2'-O)-methyltransferase